MTPRSSSPPLRLPRWAQWLGLAVTLLGLAYLAVGGVVASKLLTSKRNFTTVTPTDQGLPYEAITLTARDGTHIAAWFIPSEGSDRAILMVHGKDSSRTNEYQGRFIELAAELHEQGYAILMMDLRSHGESEGRYFTLGAMERWDVVEAVDYLDAQGFDNIGAIAVSLGGASVAEATPLTDKLDAVVLDSVYPDLHALLSRELPRRGGLPAWFLPGSLFMARFLTGGTIGDVAPAAHTAQVDVPMLVMYGTEDDLVPDEEFDDFEAVNPDATTWVRPGAFHARLYTAYHDEYMSHVLPFFDEHLR